MNVLTFNWTFQTLIMQWQDTCFIPLSNLMYSNVAQINLINIDMIATVTGFIRRASHLGSVDVKVKHTHQLDTIGYWGSNVINLFYYTFLSWNQSSYRARTYVFILQGRQYMPTIHDYKWRFWPTCCSRYGDVRSQLSE